MIQHLCESEGEEGQGQGITWREALSVEPIFNNGQVTCQNHSTVISCGLYLLEDQTVILLGKRPKIMAQIAMM